MKEQRVTYSQGHKARKWWSQPFTPGVLAPDCILLFSILSIMNHKATDRLLYFTAIRLKDIMMNNIAINSMPHFSGLGCELNHKSFNIYNYNYIYII